MQFKQIVCAKRSFARPAVLFIIFALYLLQISCVHETSTDSEKSIVEAADNQAAADSIRGMNNRNRRARRILEMNCASCHGYSRVVFGPPIFDMSEMQEEQFRKIYARFWTDKYHKRLAFDLSMDEKIILYKYIRNQSRIVH